MMNRPQDILQALRPNQWTKNIVVLAAFFFALGDRSLSIPLSSFYPVLLATVFFCFASSGIYIINDIKDLEADRVHPVKKHRAIAAGRVSIPLITFISFFLMGVALAGAFWISRPFALILSIYVSLQFIYTFWLKEIALVDVFIIALGFVLRAAGGGLAMPVPIPISPWLLLCAFLLALFLALCKRRHEKILMVGAAVSHRANLEFYDTKLLDQLIAIVGATTIVSYAIYTLSTETVHKFGTPLLAVTIPFVMFGIFRYLDLVYRKEGGGRPEKTLLTDIILIVDLCLFSLCLLGIFVYTRHFTPHL
ncbi:MAG: decaprenyl-phosphate phosphoribosyltransferase [bacterium]